MRVKRQLGANNGMALVMVLMALVLLTAVAMTVALLASVETHLSAGFRWRQESLAFAEAGLELGCAALAGEADWSAVLAGVRRADLPGAATMPSVGGWGVIDLEEWTRRLQTDSDSATVWGVNAPRWRLYAHGRPAMLFPSPWPTPTPYVAIWVADDESEEDGLPEHDSNAVILLRAEAFGVGRAHQAVLATVRRRPHGTSVVSWRVPADRTAGW